MLEPSTAGREAILRERARRLAQPRQAAETPGVDVIVFQLSWENYAVEASYVREIAPLRALTPVPCTPAYVLGLINLRGELCPVIDLKRLLGLPEQGVINATSAVVLHGYAMEFAIVADVIVGVRSLAHAEIQAPIATLTGVNAAFLRGVTADRTIVLNARSILGHPGVIVNETVE